MSDISTPTPSAPVENIETPESAPEVQENASEAPENTKKEAAAAAAAKRKYKLKVDGAEEELELSDEEITQHLQKAKAADKRFQEAAEYRKQATEIVRMLKTDPLKVLQHPGLGHDVRKLAEEYLIAQMEEESLSPEARELKQAREKLKAIAEKEAADEEAKRTEELQELKNHYSQAISQDIIKALETSGLPKSNSTVRRMAQYLKKALRANIQVTAEQVTELVRRDYEREIKDLYGAADPETLIKLLGEEGAKKVRKFDVDKFKRPTNTFASSKRGDGAAATSNKKEKKEEMTPEQFREYISRKTQD